MIRFFFPSQDRVSLSIAVWTADPFFFSEFKPTIPRCWKVPKRVMQFDALGNYNGRLWEAPITQVLKQRITGFPIAQRKIYDHIWSKSNANEDVSEFYLNVVYVSV
jgi:hypothetical protein